MQVKGERNRYRFFSLGGKKNNQRFRYQMYRTNPQPSIPTRMSQRVMVANLHVLRPLGFLSFMKWSGWVTGPVVFSKEWFNIQRLCLYSRRASPRRVESVVEKSGSNPNYKFLKSVGPLFQTPHCVCCWCQLCPGAGEIKVFWNMLSFLFALCLCFFMCKSSKLMLGNAGFTDYFLCTCMYTHRHFVFSHCALSL